jgi:hypothetical protein
MLCALMQVSQQNITRPRETVRASVSTMQTQAVSRRRSTEAACSDAPQHDTTRLDGAHAGTHLPAGSRSWPQGALPG